VSLRKACRASGTAMSSMQYGSVRSPQEPLRSRIKEIAHARVSHGNRRSRAAAARGIEGEPRSQSRPNQTWSRETHAVIR
jgi:hypothetical protein